MEKPILIPNRLSLGSPHPPIDAAFEGFPSEEELRIVNVSRMFEEAISVFLRRPA